MRAAWGMNPNACFPYKAIVVLTTSSLLLSFSQSKPDSRTPLPHFEDVALRVGLSVPHISSRSKDFILDTISGGIGFIDCDNDGRLDVLAVNGSTVDEYRNNSGHLMLTLYHQEPDLKFTDITRRAGLTRRGWGMGIAVADYDNDGLPDIYVTGFGHNILYHNLGNCQFEDVTERAGVAGGGFSTAAAWADYDRDGNVDLFVTRYVQLDTNRLPPPGSSRLYCTYFGRPVHCGPQGLLGETDLLYRNRGDGTFQNVSETAGLSRSDLHYGLGAIWGDYDNDGWPDLYVASDAGTNFLYHNTRDGKFEEVGMIQGVALSSTGLIQGSMGVDWGDFDHDGQQDLLVTAFTGQSLKLYRNLGKLGFADVGTISQIAEPTVPLIGWGVGFFDMDNSGWLDIIMANGHIYPQADSIAETAHYHQPLLVFHNQRNGKFENVSSALGTLTPASWRGLALGDVNNDGCVDVAVLNVDGPPSLLLNHCPVSNHRVLLKLLGTASNQEAIGARVTVKTARMSQFDEVRGGGSYMSQNDSRLHFGFGPEDKIDLLEIRWPSGRKETIRDLPADFIYTIVEGKGINAKKRIRPGEP